MKSEFERSCGHTPSEKFLAELANHTFLGLWSWPNVYKVPGKELCDLLVVCGDDVLVFSDKSIAWPSGSIEVAWRRWYQRAISKSVDQIRGGVRWLQNNPRELYADSRCSVRVPLSLPPNEQRRVHGICVALGAEEAASAYFQDPDGNFMILPDLKGDGHLDFGQNGHRPFAIGDVDPLGPFVHIFNQFTLSLVMSELDTITDFTGYLTAREDLIRSGRLLASPSEMELLANYLLWMRNGRHAFPTLEDVGATADSRLIFGQGEYVSFLRSPEYLWRQDVHRKSQPWDRIIRLFTEHVLGGTQYRVFDIEPDVQLAERALRFMAREDRIRRSLLGQALLDAMLTHEKQKFDRLARVMMPSATSIDPKLAYVFMVIMRNKQVDYEIYRRIRGALLETYCLAVLHDNRGLERCVGLALSSLTDQGSSEDLIAIEQLDWSEKEVESLRNAREHYEVMMDPSKLTQKSISMTEFPPDPALLGISRQQRRARERALRKAARRSR